MRTAHLFAGVGGGMLADLILGHTPVLAVENNAFCCKVLEERKKDGWFTELRIECADVREFDFKPWRGKLDTVAAGFPCQDISAAGKGAGINGSRSGLVWEVFRAIDEIQPKFIFLENSPNIRTKGRKEVTAALVARGYRWRDGKISAADVGAPHLRERWFCLASNADGLRELQTSSRQSIRSGAEKRGNTADNSTQDDADLVRPRLEKFRRGPGNVSRKNQAAQRFKIQISESDAATIAAVANYTGASDWLQIDAIIRGDLHGVSDKSHRIKGLGNAQVPLQAAAAFMILSGLA